MLNNDNNANAEYKKKQYHYEKRWEQKLEYMADVDNKLFKEYSNGKNFNSFINEFDRATNKEDK